MSLFANYQYVFLYEKLSMQLLVLQAVKEKQDKMAKKLEDQAKKDNSPFASLISTVATNTMNLYQAANFHALGPFSVVDIPILKGILLNMELAYYSITSKTKEQLHQEILCNQEFVAFLQKINPTT